MPTAALNQHHLRPGRRGSTLALIGGYDLILGVSYVRVGAPEESKQQSLTLALQLAPIEVWGCLFALAGLLACIAVYWPPGKDQWGFVPLAGVTVWWCCVYFVGWVVYASPRAWTSALSWAAVAVLLLIISGWPEPRDERIRAASEVARREDAAGEGPYGDVP